VKLIAGPGGVQSQVEFISGTYVWSNTIAGKLKGFTVGNIN